MPGLNRSLLDEFSKQNTHQSAHQIVSKRRLLPKLTTVSELEKLGETKHKLQTTDSYVCVHMGPTSLSLTDIDRKIAEL